MAAEWLEDEVNFSNDLELQKELFEKILADYPYQSIFVKYIELLEKAE